MQPTLSRYFPTAQSVLEAPVFDVAGVMLEMVAQRAANQSYVTPGNEISGWAAGYGQHNLEAVTRALSEVWAWLVTNGFIAEEFKQGAIQVSSSHELARRFDLERTSSLTPSQVFCRAKFSVPTSQRSCAPYSLVDTSMRP